MERFQFFVFCLLIFLAKTSAYGIERHNVDKKCDPSHGNDDCKKNIERCQDHDADGHWTCGCAEGYVIPKDDHGGLCLSDACTMYTSGKGLTRRPTESNGEYVTVLDKCYFMEFTPMEYTQAVTNCKTQFHGAGRLYEPRDKEMNDKVVNTARSINTDEFYWLGVRTRPHLEEPNRKFYYLSEGPKKDQNFNAFWSQGEPNDILGKEDCVSVLRFNSDLGWRDTDCKKSGFSICEVDEEESCKKPKYANDNFCDDENNHAGCNWDGGACCHNPLEGWDNHCKECKCKYPHDRKPKVPCEDINSAKACQKCNSTKKCKAKKCKDKCRKTCHLC